MDQVDAAAVALNHSVVKIHVLHVQSLLRSMTLGAAALAAPAAGSSI
jgi:hypothetical protein